MFVDRGVTELRFTPAYEALRQDYRGSVRGGLAFLIDDPWEHVRHPSNPFDERLLPKFDYILVIHREDFPLPLPDNLTLVFRGRDFQMFRIDHVKPPAELPVKGREPG
jgi:hypothetical protein